VEAQDRLSRTLQRYGARRDAEARLAEAFDADLTRYVQTSYFTDTWEPRLIGYVEKMKTCRLHGVAGVKPDGRVVVAWEEKCDCLRLCPDAAREDQVRVLKQYLAPILEAKRQGYRIYKLVLSPPNVPQGELRAGKRALFATWRAVMKERNCWGIRALPGFKGALVVQEDPMGTAGDWNVHLNVILIYDGRLEYKEFREWWRWACDIKSEADMVKATRKVLRARGADVSKLTDADVFAAAVKECIKYPVQAVAEKSDKEEGGWIEGHYFGPDLEPAAPPMTDWGRETRLEWWQANKGFRRVRSYGCLYATPKPELPDTLDQDTDWFARIDKRADGWFIVRAWLPAACASSSVASIRRGISRQTSSPAEGEKPPDPGPPPLKMRAALLQWDAERRFFDDTPEYQHVADRRRWQILAPALAEEETCVEI